MQNFELQPQTQMKPPSPIITLVPALGKGGGTDGIPYRTPDLARRTSRHTRRVANLKMILAMLPQYDFLN